MFCGLSSSYSEIISNIITYCENHFIHFFHVPSVRNYLKRRMFFEMMGNVPILSIRQEPLAQPENRLIKRTFDVEAFKALAHKDALEEKEKRRQMRIRRDGSEKA